jgi:hypothetical protein
MSIRQRYLDLSLGAGPRADHRVLDGLEPFIASVLFLIRLSRTWTGARSNHPVELRPQMPLMR